MKKAELRKIHLAKRAQMTPESVRKMSEKIAQLFFESTDLKSVKTLHTFIPIHKFNEVDTSKIYTRVWAEHPQIATVLPRTDLAAGVIESVRFDAQTELAENNWGIREPCGGKVIDPSAIDMVIVPLLCFDKNGHRVGYGKGMYDRFLSRCRTDCLKVGVSLFEPLESIEDIHEADITLDVCITSDRLFLPNKKDAAETVRIL